MHVRTSFMMEEALQINGEHISFQHMVLGGTGNPYGKNDMESLPHIKHKNQF